MHAKCDIQSRREAILKYNSEHKWRKRGLSIIPTKFGINFTAKFLNQAGALVHVYTDGTVLVSHGGTEMGQGLHTKMIQVAARALGISVDRVHISESSTSSVPNASPTAASASSDMYGMAVLNACEQIAEKLAPYYKKINDGKNEEEGKKTDPEQLEKWGDDKSFGAAVLNAYFDRVNLSAQGFYKVPGCGYDWGMPQEATASDNAIRGTPFNYFTFGISCSEVEIDVMTGDMRILRADVMMEMGNPINPALDVGQIEGAYVQGMGWCMMEECVWGAAPTAPTSDGETKSDEFIQTELGGEGAGHVWLRPGTCFTRGPGTYKIPSFNDVPVDMRIYLLGDAPNNKAVHSSKAIGEPPFFTASSVFFATRNAIAAARNEHANDDSFFIVNSPLTPERIRMACGDTISQSVQRHMMANGGSERPPLFC
jgi:xanthine dehydrogenase/oxidase